MKGAIYMGMEYSDKPLRLFIAVRLPEFMKFRLEQWKLGHAEELPFRKWTHREDYHITVQFLGDTDPRQIHDITEALTQAASRIHPFQLKFGRLETFGLPESPRVLWAGVNDDCKGLDKLYQTVTEAMGELGFAKESRPYHPHITIARKYAGKAPFFEHHLKPVMPEMPVSARDRQNLIWEVEEFVLFSTHLHDQPMYEILKAFRMEDS